MKTTAEVESIESAIAGHRLPLYVRAHKILGPGSRDMAEDFVQEVMLRALERKRDFESENHVKGWMMIHIKFVIYDYYGRVKISQTHLGSESDVALIDIPVMPEQEAHLQWREFLTVFTMLSDKDRRILWGITVDGVKYDDMAKQEKTTEPTIRGKLYRAKQFLKAHFGLPDTDTISLGVVTGDHHLRSSFEG